MLNSHLQNKGDCCRRDVKEQLIIFSAVGGIKIIIDAFAHFRHMAIVTIIFTFISKHAQATNVHDHNNFVGTSPNMFIIF